MRATLGMKNSASKKQREAVCHYLLIYLMVAFADSFLYDRILTNIVIPVVALIALIVMANRKYQLVYPISILALGFLAMLFVRVSTNALGRTELLSWVAMVGITLIAVMFDVSSFLIRFIKLAAFLTGLSLVVYLISQVFPGVWGHLSPFSFFLSFGDTTWLDSVNRIVVNYRADGLLLYVDRGFDHTRNVGIFREPAVYQILLNSAIFVLLFMKPKEIDKKTRARLLALFVAGVLSTKSATGYATTLLVFFAYSLSSLKRGDRVSAIVPLFLGSICVFVFIASAMGSSAWATDSVLGRFMNDGGISLDASGEARVGAANAALTLMQRYPFGCGYNVYGAAISTGNSEFVGACLLKVAAVYGPIMGIAILIWTCYPVFKSRELGLSAKLAFVAMYLIATYLECEVFYTTLIFIPIYLYCKNVAETSVQPLRAAASSFGVLREAR